MLGRSGTAGEQPAGGGPAPASGASQPGRVLTVCTGNICRSPLLERVLQLELDRAWGVSNYEVASAGTQGLQEYPMDDRAASVLTGFGGSDHGFVARRMRPTMVAQAHLVLTATLDHRAHVVRAHPAALRYAFTFREFAALAGSVPDAELPGPAAPVERLRALCALLMQRRGHVVVPEPDIIDPYRRGDEVYRQMEQEIRAALSSVVRILT